jgi:pyridoxamine 5'-phosphate oxidase
VAELRRSDLDPDPVAQFRRWFAEAPEAAPPREAAALASATGDGVPSVRMVLVKGVDDAGLAFFTHYASRKGRELAENPAAALLFHWWQLGRQVRVEGSVARLPAAESDAYFATRPRAAQLGALASRQSEPLSGRDELERRVEELEREHAGGEVARPETWGGYRLVASAWEFWQHRDDRLHDRFRYEQNAAGWTIARLWP